MTQRREFILGSGAFLAAAGASGTANAGTADPFKGTKGVPLRVGEPCLQAPAETTMGVSWSVSGLAKGVVEVADNAEMRNARTIRSGGFGLVPIDVAALQVRLEGLKPSTRYWYRTVTTPFTDYSDIYNAKLGEPIVGRVHSFQTMGRGTPARFCVINDTHAVWDSFEMVAAKLKELKPSLVVWNGDATETTQDKQTAVRIFLNPPIASADYAADLPVAFESGNHDFRGSWISKKEEVILPRHPAERSGAEWDLKWNFAVRLGQLALIGLDTGEDKPDAHPKWFGLANFEAYRKAQAVWLEKTLSRPDVAKAKHKVAICHIPLYVAPDHPSYPHDGAKIDPVDYAHWSRECHDLWAPILERHGVKLVIAGHVHRYRLDRPEPGRSWYQVTGGSPRCVEATKNDPGRYPTVIEGIVSDGRLVIRVHDAWHDRIVNEFQVN